MPSVNLADLVASGASRFPGLVGVEIISAEVGRLTAELAVRPELTAPNGYLHAGTVVALADTAAGYGSALNLPERAVGFTTLELKANFVGTAVDGRLRAVAELVHAGRTTQFWQVTVRSVDPERMLAHFTCTQLMIYPR